MNWLKIFKPNIGAGTYTPPPPHIPHPDNSFAPSCPSPPRIPPPEKKPRGRLVPQEHMDGCYYIEVYDEGLKDFIRIDSTNSERYGRSIIEEYFENKEIKKRGIVYVY